MSENTEATAPTAPQTNEESRIIALNGKNYLFESLSDEAKGAFTQALEINEKIEGKKVDIRDLTYSRQYLVDFLEKNAESFTEVQEVQEDAELDSEDLAKAEAEATA